MEGSRVITVSGRNIPDPPEDPEERRRWKTIYFADLYGVGPEQRERILRNLNQQEARTHRFSERRPIWSRRWVRFVAYRILAPIGVIAALVYLFAGCKPEKVEATSSNGWHRVSENSDLLVQEHRVGNQLVLCYRRADMGINAEGNLSCVVQ